MDAGFDRVDADIRELRREMRDGFGELRGEFGAELRALTLMLMRIGGGLLVGTGGRHRSSHAPGLRPAA